MDMMTLTQLGEQTNLDPQILRDYRDAYILYIPAVRVGQNIGFPAEAISVIQEIHTLTEQGRSHDEVMAELEKTYPITVIASQPLAREQQMPSGMPAVSGLLKDVDTRYVALNDELVQIREELGKTASEQRALQIQQMITGATTSTHKRLESLPAISAELTQIRQAVGVLASRVERQGTTALHERTELATSIETLASQLPKSAPGITEELNAVRLEIAELRASIPDYPLSALGTESLNLLTSEIGSLKTQLTDLRRERGQMISLMSALQDNLAQLHMELADARQRSLQPLQSEDTEQQIVTITSQDVATAQFNGHSNGTNGDFGTASLRTPRRLGHQTK